MRTVNIPKRSRKLFGLLEQAKHENLVLRSEDGTEFILAEIDDFNREIELTRQNSDLIRYLETRARETKTIPLAEARTQLDL
ncbi:MAG TPA: hypothetical protein PKH07_04805 [bacterium]|nr:hypothetical protein [bacterium]